MIVGVIGSELNLLSGSSKPIIGLINSLNNKNIICEVISDKLNDPILSINSELKKKLGYDLLNIKRIDGDLLKSIMNNNLEVISSITTLFEKVDLVLCTDFLIPHLLEKKGIKIKKPIVFIASNNLHLKLSYLIDSGYLSCTNLKKVSFLSKLVLPKKLIGNYLSKFDLIIATSEFVKNSFSEYEITSPIINLPVGIDIPNYSEQSIGKYSNYFSFFGWGSGIRGLQDVIKSYSMYRTEGEYTKLNLYLQGQHGFEEQQYIRQILKSKFSEDISINLFTKDIESAIIESKAVILPFRAPFGYSQPPLTILESMALGRVVISTNVGSISELITNQQDGYLVKPNDPKAISEILLNLSDLEIEKIGRNAINRIQRNNSWDLVSNNYIECFNNQLGV